MISSKLALGLSLVELMIAMSLGIVISTLAIQLYVSHSGVLNLQRSISLIQEQGRYAQELLSAQMRLSGYGGTQGVVKSFVFSEDSDGEFHDVLEIQVAGAGVDCMGGSLDVESSIKRKRFYVKKDVLLCSDSDGIRAPIIQHVESFQVVYGVDLDESAFFSAGYGSADVYVDGKALVAEPSAHVVSVKISLVLKSPHKVGVLAGSDPNRDVWVLNQYIPDNFTASSDGYLRRVFVSTTALRNFVAYEWNQN